jgi:hypothetical protein
VLQLLLSMDKKTRIITLAALFVAFSVIFLYLGSVIPTIRLGFAAAASLFAVAAVIETGLVSASFVYIGSSVISLLLLPDKTVILLYVLFLGYYPIIKSLAERSRSIILCWAAKIALFEAAYSVIWFLFKRLIFDSKFIETNIIFIYLAGTAAFVVYDVGLTRLIGFYIQRISKNLRKNKQ